MPKRTAAPADPTAPDARAAAITAPSTPPLPTVPTAAEEIQALSGDPNFMMNPMLFFDDGDLWRL